MAPRRRRVRRKKQGSAYEELVATVAKAMSPGAEVKQGTWSQGPDGRRDMDVVIHGIFNGRQRTVLIECKDFNPASTGRVGIEFVDGLDSKRRDLRVDAALLCSNSGFTEGALRKAKRVGIGLVSVLKKGDPRVKLQIQEEIYFRRITLTSVNVTIHPVGDLAPSGADLVGRLRYEGGLVTDWAFHRAALISSANPRYNGAPLIVSQTFAEPVVLDAGDVQVAVSEITLRFTATVEWRAQTVTLDASLGLYDYLRGRVRLAAGEQQYVMNGVDLHAGTPIDFVPPAAELAASLEPGEMQVSMCMVYGVPETPPPPLDELLVEEDRDIIIPEAVLSALIHGG